MLAVHNGWTIADADVTTAFMHAAEEELIYTLPADCWRKQSWCWMSTNGERECRLDSHFTSVLKELGLAATNSGPCMFVCKERQI